MRATSFVIAYDLLCHREERSDVAISILSRRLPRRDCRASLAMTAPATMGNQPNRMELI